MGCAPSAGVAITAAAVKRNSRLQEPTLLAIERQRGLRGPQTTAVTRSVAVEIGLAQVPGRRLRGHPTRDVVGTAVSALDAQLRIALEAGLGRLLEHALDVLLAGSERLTGFVLGLGCRL